jgi:hypothetical protein
VRGDAVEAIKSSLFLRITSQHAHVHSRVPEIRTHLGAGDGDEPDDAGILCRFGEECRYLDADRFGDAVRSTGVTQKRPPPKSASVPPAPYGSTRARRRP